MGDGHHALPRFSCRAPKRKYLWKLLRHRQACCGVGGLRDPKMGVVQRGSGRVPRRGFIGQYLLGSGNGFQGHEGDA